MPTSSNRRLIVIVKRRPFDEAAWKRLLIAYAYARYDQCKKQTAQTDAPKAVRA